MVSIVTLILLVLLPLYADFAMVPLYYDTTAMQCRASREFQILCFTDETLQSASDPNMNVGKAPFLSFYWVPTIAFMKDSDQELSCANTEVCPKLVRYHTKFTKIDDVRFSTQFVASTGSDTDQPGIAGYLAPTQGYCGATGDAIIEMYSELYRTYYYMNASQVDSDSSFQIFEIAVHLPVRLVGYSFEIGTQLPLTGIAPHYINPAANKVPQTFHPLRAIFRFSSGNKFSYCALTENIEKLWHAPNSNYSFDSTLELRILRTNNLVSTARAKCGATSYLYEVYDSTTDVTRLSTKTKIKPTDKTLAVAGLSFKAASTKCGFIHEAVEYQNKEDPTRFLIQTADDPSYSTAPEWIKTQSLGFMRLGTLLMMLDA